MSNAYGTFSIIFREHAPTALWEKRKHVVAAFVALCWEGEKPQDAWNEVDPERSESFEYFDEIIDKLCFCKYEDRGSTFFLTTFDYEEVPPYRTILPMKQGMKKYFPDIDYEFHYLEAIDGEVSDEITIVDNGKEFNNHCIMLYPQVILEDDNYLNDNDLIEEDEEPPKTRGDILKLKSFMIPEAAEDNPHPLPECVLVSEDEEDDYPPTSPKWFFLKNIKYGESNPASE